MRAWLRSAPVLLLLFAPLPVAADVPPFGGPRPPPGPPPPFVNVEKPAPKTVTLTIRAEAGRRTTQFFLPLNTLQVTRAESLPGGEGSDLSAGRTIVAGVALSVALVVGGLWLARGGRRRVLPGFVCLLAAAAVVGVSCLPRHDDPPKLVPEELPPPTMQPDSTLAGRCQMFNGKAGDEVVLSINRDALAELARPGRKTEVPAPASPTGGTP